MYIYLGGVRCLFLERWQAARWELTVRFLILFPLFLLALKLRTDSCNNLLLLTKCVANLLNVVRDAYCLVPD